MPCILLLSTVLKTVWFAILVFGPKNRTQRQTVPCASGYLVLEDFAAPDEVAKLKQRAEEIIGNYDASNPSIFSTVNQASGVCDHTHILHHVWFWALRVTA